MVDGRRVLTTLLVALALGAIGLGLAIAQDGSDELAPGEVPVRIRANVMPQDQLDEANEIVTRGETVGARVQRQLEESRRSGDIIRVTCLNDKVTQLTAHRSTARTRYRRLADADRAGDRDRAQHEYTVLVVLGGHFRNLEGEAAACVGEDIYETGATQVSTEIDPNTPDESLLMQDPPEDPAIPPPLTIDI